MATTHDMESSINEAILGAGITWNSEPVRIVFDAPERVGVVYPVVAIHHLPVQASPTYMGDMVAKAPDGARVKGYTYRCLLEWNVWASRQDADWMVQLKQICDQMSLFIIRNRIIKVNQYSGGTKRAFDDLPAHERSVIYFEEIRESGTIPPDPNEDLERIRMLVPYEGTLS